MRKIILFVFILNFFFASAQETFMVNGTHNKNHTSYAFTHATIYIDYATKIVDATLLIKDGKVIAVQPTTKLELPKDVVIYNLKGKYIYPSFIDLYANYGVSVTAKNKKHRSTLSNKKGAFNWNQAIHPEVKAGELFVVNDKQAAEMRGLGFGSVLTHQQDGIMRGSSAFVTLGNEKANMVMIADKVANHLAFNKGTSTQKYPGSLMGMIALIRQTYYDAQWILTTKNPKEYNISLNSINENAALPQIFEANDKFNILRADKIGDEFGVQYIFKGKGDEYQRIAEIKNTGGSLILPINFPKAYDVSDVYDAMNVSYSAIKHWELAPYNLGIVASNNIPFAITTSDLKDKKTFFKKIQKAIKLGLSEKDALKALTYSPANFINMYDVVGSLDAGKKANFIITSKPVFSESNIIYENWISGKRYMLNPYDVVDVRGDYSLYVGKQSYDLKVEGSLQKPKGSIQVVLKKEGKSDTTNVKVAITTKGRLINLSFNPNDDFQNTTIRLSGSINHNAVIWDGNGQVAMGEWVKWSAIKGKHKALDNKIDTTEVIEFDVPKIQYPNMAYGFGTLPKAFTMIIRGATVWTNEAEGILKNTDVLIRNGKIAEIGKNLYVQDAVIIDGKGKHLSAGIIDEHSHIAISKGVNECTQSVTAEVSIADVVNSDDINIYRQLAGGVVASQLLHGSCNPVGGQSAIIKLKWGSSPEEMKIKNTDGFIKFALGENVKRAGGYDRFPQTRMGVEQVYYDAFTRAKEYQKAKDDFAALPEKQQLKTGAESPRVDLELETLTEILNQTRFISCHSYIQSEITYVNDCRRFYGVYSKYFYSYFRRV